MAQIITIIRIEYIFFIQVNDYKMWHVIFNNLDINDSHYIYLNATAIKLLCSVLDSHVQNKISSWYLDQIRKTYERKLFKHLNIDYNESNDIFLEILEVENIVYTNQESEKIELSISK